MPLPTEMLAALPLGTRVVVRYRVPGGLTDALGTLVARTAQTCTVATRAGNTDVALSEIVAAKPVPPPPRRRNATPNPTS